MEKFGVLPSSVDIDLFARAKNKQEPLFCSKVNSCWSYNWAKLPKHPADYLWANPPFSKLARAVTKVALEKARVIMITPDWGTNGINGYWRRVLDRLTVKRFVLPEVALYEKFGNPEKLLPKPHWSTLISILDGAISQVDDAELDPSIVKLIKKKAKGWGREELKARVHEKFSSEVMETTFPENVTPPPSQGHVQEKKVDFTVEHENAHNKGDLKEEIPIPMSVHEHHEHNADMSQEQVCQTPLPCSPISPKTPFSFEETFDFDFRTPEIQILAEISTDVDISFTKTGWIHFRMFSIWGRWSTLR